MSNPFLQLADNLEQSSSLIAQYSKGDISSLKMDLQQDIETKKLQIMLYGAYNSGKSSLLNTLLGREAALVNDVPTTDKVTQYDWNGFYLLDTPGVNAPIAHEEATKEQVKRTGAILFVIREGDQDSKDIYDRLFNMLSRGKKIFIVLNHQLSNQDDKLTAIKKINSILCELAPKYQIKDEAIAHITVLPINIRTAYNGRIKKHEKLLEHSGYTAFMQSFEQWIFAQNQNINHLETLKNKINECWYMPAINRLKPIVEAGESTEFKNLCDDRLMLESEKRSLRTSVDSFITRQVNLIKSDVSNALQTCSSQSELDSKLQFVFMPLIPKIEAWLTNELGRVSNNLSIPVNFQHPTSNVNESSNQFSDALISAAKDVLKDSDYLKQTLLLGRKLKIPVLKGRWEKTLGEWAGKAAIAVQVITFFYDIYKANEDQDRENQQNRQKSIELYQAVEQICGTVISDMMDSVHELILMAFNEKTSAIQHQINEFSREESDAKSHYNKLNRLKEEASTFYFNS